MYELTCDHPIYLILVLMLEPRAYRRRDNNRRKSVLITPLPSLRLWIINLRHSSDFDDAYLRTLRKKTKYSNNTRYPMDRKSSSHLPGTIPALVNQISLDP